MSCKMQDGDSVGTQKAGILTIWGNKPDSTLRDSDNLGQQSRFNAEGFPHKIQ